MEFSIFDTVLILLIVSIITSSIFQKFNIPVIVGYLAVGISLGPHAIGVLTDNSHVRELAEFGMVFLMFNIGLEFSFAKIIKMKRSVFVLGGLEVALTILSTIGMGHFLNLTFQEAIILGSIIAMSSTAIVVKQLSSQRQLKTRYGENAIGILLFQDLAVIPILILIPSMVDTKGSFPWEVSQALLTAILAIAFIFLLGRKILRPVFTLIANMRNLEVFTLTTLFVTLAAAWLTQSMGLSMTLGAFLAGMMLGETEFRHQIENDIRPFRDVLMGFFFITIGSQFSVQATMEFWPWVLILFLALVLFKTTLVLLLGIVFKEGKVSALRSGIILAHGGEFGFAILTLALSYQLLPPDYGQVTLAALLLSMLIAPLMIRYSLKIANLFFSQPAPSDPQQLALDGFVLDAHVIIGGFGRVGQRLASFLEKVNVPYVAFDLDPSIVVKAQRQGKNVIFADLTHHHTFERINLQKARALVLSFNDSESNIKIIQQIRALNRKIDIIARAHDEIQSDKLILCGATEVIPEVYEASLSLASRLMSMMGIEPAKIDQMLYESRKDRESSS